MKTCNFCGRSTYKVRGWWTDAETTFICNGCNFNEDECSCPKVISEPDEPPRDATWGNPIVAHEHDDLPHE